MAAAAPVSEEPTVLLFYHGAPYRVPLDLVEHHPNGDSLILPYVGKDVTRVFEEAGHSRGAGQLLHRYRIRALPVVPIGDASQEAAHRHARNGATSAGKRSRTGETFLSPALSSVYLMEDVGRVLQGGVAADVDEQVRGHHWQRRMRDAAVRAEMAARWSAIVAGFGAVTAVLAGVATTYLRSRIAVS